MPFYAWLRRFAWDRLVEVHRRHVKAERRSVDCEQSWSIPAADRSSAGLADRLVGSGTSPSRHLLRAESRLRVRTALEQLRPRDREILVLLYMEDLSAVQIGGILGMTEGAIRVRHVRALERLRRLMPEDDSGEGRR
jgi:RNA polymerase sigma-70 factor (ECF subfamily)